MTALEALFDAISRRDAAAVKRALGIPTAWINRKHEPPTGDARPDVEFGTLAEAAAWLTSA